MNPHPPPSAPSPKETGAAVNCRNAALPTGPIADTYWCLDRIRDEQSSGVASDDPTIHCALSQAELKQLQQERAETKRKPPSRRPYP